MVETCSTAEELWNNFEANFKCKPTNRARKLAMRRLYTHSDSCTICQVNGRNRPYGLAVAYPWERTTTTHTQN